MMDVQQRKPIKTPQEYFDIYMNELVAGLKQKGKRRNIEAHPAVMQEKLRELDETHFGYDLFGYLKNV